MSLLDAEGTTTVEIGRTVTTDVADLSSLATSRQHEDMERWDALVDRYLIEWGKDPESLRDGDIVPPTKEAIQRACDVALRFRDLGLSAPTRVVTDGEGGVAFERLDGDCAVTIEIQSDGTVEIRVFDRSVLVLRQNL
jgi:hypothetical protein